MEGRRLLHSRLIDASAGAADQPGVFRAGYARCAAGCRASSVAAPERCSYVLSRGLAGVLAAAQ